MLQQFEFTEHLRSKSVIWGVKMMWNVFKINFYLKNTIHTRSCWRYIYIFLALFARKTCFEDGEGNKNVIVIKKLYLPLILWNKCACGYPESRGTQFDHYWPKLYSLVLHGVSVNGLMDWLAGRMRWRQIRHGFCVSLNCEIVIMYHCLVQCR
jgi:hypothetical protein